MLHIENRLHKVESLLSQIRILVVILMVLSLVGFYGLSRLMGAISIIWKSIIFFVGALVVCYLILLIMGKLMGIKKYSGMKEEDMQRILKEIESEKNDESS